jgi:DNA-binding beta-propeller fold protein YncE
VDQTLIILPLNSLIDAELRQGEYWKITVDINGVKTIGYIHEFLVEEVDESEFQRDAVPVGTVRTQDQLIAQIEVKIEDNKDLLTRPDIPMEPVIESLRSLVPRLFGIEDPLKQKQLACDLYLWTGHALSKHGDEAGATREFRNMFEVDFLQAKKATRYIVESRISQLINTAEKQYNGTFLGYVLQVDTEPKEAVLKINGEVVGRTPYILTTDKPRVTLEIEKEGYRSERSLIVLGETKTVREYVLERVGSTLRVSSDPPGAAVFLDGRDTGKVTECELLYVPFGPHTLTIKKDLYADWEEALTVEKGKGDVLRTVVLAGKTYVSASIWGSTANKGFVLPSALALDKAGYFYVVDDSAAKVRKYNPERGGLMSWGNQGKSFKAMKQPSGIAIDGEGACYVTDPRGPSVIKFDKTGRQVLRLGPSGVKEGSLVLPVAVAVDRANDVYVVDAGKGRIIRYSSSGALKKAWGRLGSGPGDFSNPMGVAINSRNEIIVADLGRILKFTPEGVFIGSIGKPGSGEGELGRPLGICCDQTDHIYVADGKNNRVAKFDLNGKYICSFGGFGSGPGQMKGPVNVVLNDKGSIFVLEKDNNRIQEFRIPAK